MEMKIKLLNNNARVPTRGSEYSAGYDLYAAITEPINIAPHETIKINTGIAIELPERTFGAIFARSGLATKQGLRPANAVGVVDSDYRGPVIVALHNDSNQTQTIVKGQRIAQLVILPFIEANFKVIDELTDTTRGSSGFGSTGSV